MSSNADLRAKFEAIVNDQPLPSMVRPVIKKKSQWNVLICASLVLAVVGLWVCRFQKQIFQCLVPKVSYKELVVDDPLFQPFD